MEDQIKKAVEVLKSGGIIIFPTDTAFGMGCRIDDLKAIDKLFTLRKRPRNKPTPVLCSTQEMVEQYVKSIPEGVQERLMNSYWPGALTIILPANNEKVPELLRGKGIGMRIPNQPILRDIIDQVGVPIIGTSANIAGQPTPYRFEDLDPNLIRQVDFVLQGECSIGQESTVIDTMTTPWRILRQGAITIQV